MSCYFRHLKVLFAEAGIEVASDNRKEIDRAIHQLLGNNYKDCPATWQKLKQSIVSDKRKRREFVDGLRDAAQ